MNLASVVSRIEMWYILFGTTIIQRPDPKYKYWFITDVYRNEQLVAHSRSYSIN